MNLKNFIPLLLVMVVFAANPTVAQKNAIEVRAVQNKTFVDFKNSNGTITKTLNIEALNPYNNFQAKGTRSGSAWTFTESLLSESGKSALAVSHSVKVFEGDFQLQQLGETTLVVYNDSGSEIFKQIIQADNGYWPLVSANLKYAAISFTGLVHDGVTAKVGFSIYDIRTKSLVLDFPTSDVSYAWSLGDIFLFSAADSGYEGTRTYYAFDTNTGKLFKKQYYRNELSKIKRFGPDGIVFSVSPEVERTENYLTHFSPVSK